MTAGDYRRLFDNHRYQVILFVDQEVWRDGKRQTENTQDVFDHMVSDQVRDGRRALPPCNSARAFSLHSENRESRSVSITLSLDRHFVQTLDT